MILPMINIVEINHINPVCAINFVGLITAKSQKKTLGFNVDFAGDTGLIKIQFYGGMIEQYHQFTVSIIVSI